MAAYLMRNYRSKIMYHIGSGKTCLNSGTITWSHLLKNGERSASIWEDRTYLLARLGLTQLSDDMTRWLDRNNQTKDFSYKQREYSSLLRGLTMSADHIASASNYMPISIPRLADYKLSPVKPYGFQRRASKKKGNLILRAPTGSGKTEAALLWAQLNQAKNGRLFYALPTTASINAMYLRLKQVFNDTNNRLVGLLHSRTVSSLYSMFEGDNIVT